MFERVCQCLYCALQNICNAMPECLDMSLVQNHDLNVDYLLGLETSFVETTALLTNSKFNLLTMLQVFTYEGLTFWNTNASSSTFKDMKAPARIMP